jgi:hypothetical protein
MSEPLAAAVLKPGDLRKIADSIEMDKAKEALDRRRKEEEEASRLRQDFMEREISPQALERFNSAVRRAAEHGNHEIEILRFPAEYCTDHGRAINNFEEDWPATLTGFARKVYDGYHQHLAPSGYKMRAAILNYPDGQLGEVGLYIGW